MTRAAIYARISQDRDGDSLGVARQQKDCRQLCVDRGWSVAREYIDNNLSATARRVVRPEYQRLLEDIASGEIDAVVVYDLDRLTRRPIELEGFVNTCALAGVTQLTFVGGGVDMGTGDGLLVARIKGAFAAEESRKASERGKRKKLELAERGLPSGGGNRPFGFGSDRVTHNLDEATLIREAADRVIGGATLPEIVRDWRDRGLRSSTGGPCLIDSLKGVLLSPRTAGLREHRGRIVGDAVWDAVLDPQTWGQVKIILESRAPHRPGAEFSYPLRGLLRCGVCGTLMSGNVKNAEGKRKRHGYRCRTCSGGCGRVHVTGLALEGHVFGLLHALANTDDVRTAVLSERTSNPDAKTDLGANESKDERKLRHLDDGFSERRLPRAVWLSQRRRIETRIAEQYSQQAEQRGWSSLESLAGQSATEWASAVPEDKTLIAHGLIKSIRVFRIAERRGRNFDPNRLAIDWHYDGVLARLLPSLVVILTQDAGHR